MNFFWIGRRLLLDQTSAWWQALHPAKIKRKNNNASSLGWVLPLSAVLHRDTAQDRRHHGEGKGSAKPSSIRKSRAAAFEDLQPLAKGPGWLGTSLRHSSNSAAWLGAAVMPSALGDFCWKHLMGSWELVFCVLFILFYFPSGLFIIFIVPFPGTTGVVSSVLFKIYKKKGWGALWETSGNSAEQLWKSQILKNLHPAGVMGEVIPLA